MILVPRWTSTFSISSTAGQVLNFRGGVEILEAPRLEGANEKNHGLVRRRELLLLLRWMLGHVPQRPRQVRSYSPHIDESRHGVMRTNSPDVFAVANRSRKNLDGLSLEDNKVHTVV